MQVQELYNPEFSFCLKWWKLDSHDLIFSMNSSEGIQIEYIAIFIAILFPGALVAYELFQTVPHWTALRVYSAGIWHNAVVSWIE